MKLSNDCKPKLSFLLFIHGFYSWLINENLYQTINVHPVEASTQCFLEIMWTLVWAFPLSTLLGHYMSITVTNEAVTLNFHRFDHSNYRTEMSLYVQWTEQSFPTTHAFDRFLFIKTMKQSQHTISQYLKNISSV